MNEFNFFFFFFQKTSCNLTSDMNSRTRGGLLNVRRPRRFQLSLLSPTRCWDHIKIITLIITAWARDPNKLCSALRQSDAVCVLHLRSHTEDPLTIELRLRKTTTFGVFPQSAGQSARSPNWLRNTHAHTHTLCTVSWLKPGAFVFIRMFWLSPSPQASIKKRKRKSFALWLFLIWVFSRFF